MRIIGGICRGRKLTPIQGSDIRPTSDRTREAVFNILGPGLKGSNVLDLFAGTGALGLEALSRGAQKAIFIDKSCTAIRKNIEICRFQNQATVLEYDILKIRMDDILKNSLFDFIFLDPPYGKNMIEQVLAQTNLSQITAENTILVSEHSVREKIDTEKTDFLIYRQKKYSKTMISFIKKSSH